MGLGSMSGLPQVNQRQPGPHGAPSPAGKTEESITVIMTVPRRGKFQSDANMEDRVWGCSQEEPPGWALKGRRNVPGSGTAQGHNRGF